MSEVLKIWYLRKPAVFDLRFTSQVRNWAAVFLLRWEGELATVVRGPSSIMTNQHSTNGSFEWAVVLKLAHKHPFEEACYGLCKTSGEGFQWKPTRFHISHGMWRGRIAMVLGSWCFAVADSSSVATKKAKRSSMGGMFLSSAVSWSFQPLNFAPREICWCSDSTNACGLLICILIGRQHWAFKNWTRILPNSIARKDSMERLCSKRGSSPNITRVSRGDILSQSNSHNLIIVEC